MHVYDTAVIGCGYFAVGYAKARGNAIILEAEQTCDTHFYLPLRTFRVPPYEPTTAEGRRLAEVFLEAGIYRGDEQNTNALECAFCRYLSKDAPSILLKCRAVEIVEEDGIFRLTISTNEGLSTLRARRILSTESCGEDKTYTLLYTAKDPKATEAALLAAFPGATVEPAFYPDRYALHIDGRGHDENSVKRAVCERLSACGIALTVIYMAPVFAYRGESPLCDDAYSHPIEALEAGIRYAKEVEA